MAELAAEYEKALPLILDAFEKIYLACGKSFHKGCGSYLFLGQEYVYDRSMYDKQLLLFRLARESKEVLEIGTYMGHSAAIMLAANPTLRLTCIDINERFAKPAVHVLNQLFGNRVSFIQGDSFLLKRWYLVADLFHIDGDHAPAAVRRDFCHCLASIHRAGRYNFLFDDYKSAQAFIDSIPKHLQVRTFEVPKCPWENAYLEIELRPVDLVESQSFLLDLPTSLCEIMNRYGSDKGNGWHNYTRFYEHLWRKVRYGPLAVFELGLGTNNPYIPSSMGIHGKPGASLRGWKEFFPFAEVRGADIDRDILFTEERIKTYWCNSLDKKAVEALWEACDIKEFDIIVDDGLHTAESNIAFFEQSIDKLKVGGVYVIEDLDARTKGVLETRAEEWQKRYSLLIQFIDLPNPRNMHDNRLMVAYKLS